jgi:hypothetical protein
MGSDFSVVIPDRPLAVQMLADKYLFFGKGHSFLGFGDIDDKTTEANAVVIAHNGLIGIGDLQINLLL